MVDLMPCYFPSTYTLAYRDRKERELAYAWLSCIALNSCYLIGARLNIKTISYLKPKDFIY